MQEILFRGKTVRGDWVTGLLAHIGKSWYISNKAGIATAYEVIPSTVGQYINIKDKNGQKIFEGDIVSVFDGIALEMGVFVVKYEPQTAQFMGVNKKCACEYDEAFTTWEIIGNIYDNPELLEEVKRNDN